MTTQRTVQLQSLVDRLRGGDAAARRELIGAAYERLGLLARKMLHEDFPRLHNIHGTGSVLHEAALRLMSALEEITPATVSDFFRFAALQMRRVLIDMARRRGGEVPIGMGGQDASDAGTPQPSDSTHDPARMAVWTEFHHKVEELPEEERQVVDLYWYQGLSQTETAELLGVSQKEVSRRWIRARLKLADQVAGLEKLL